MLKTLSLKVWPDAVVRGYCHYCHLVGVLEGGGNTTTFRHMSVCWDYLHKWLNPPQYFLDLIHSNRCLWLILSYVVWHVLLCFLGVLINLEKLLVGGGLVDILVGVGLSCQSKLAVKWHIESFRFIETVLKWHSEEVYIDYYIIHIQIFDLNISYFNSHLARRVLCKDGTECESNL